MSTRTPFAKDLVTHEDFRRIVRDGEKADLIDGVIHMASPDSRRSNQITGFVEFLVKGFDAARGIGGETYVNRFSFKLTDFRAPEPDVAYVVPQRLHLVSESGMKGGPDIAVEVVSRDSRWRDYGEKKQIYQDAGVEEYWIVDPIQQWVEFHRLEKGVYNPVPLETNHVFRSRVIAGFWLNVEWLLADPLPNSYDCLHEILKS